VSQAAECQMHLLMTLAMLINFLKILPASESMGFRQ
jgi:hypothetical protein